MLELKWDALLLLAADAAEAAETASQAGSSGGSAWGNALIVLVVLIVPFLLGNLLARGLKVAEFGGRLGFVLFAATLGMTPFVVNSFRAGSVPDGFRNSIQLGIDLAGGTNLVFQAESDDPEKPITNEVMDSMMAAVGRRINPSGTEEVVVRRVGADRIEVIIPGADPERVKQVKSLITKLGSLEFAILANSRDHQDLIRRARELPDDARDLMVDGAVVASWRDVGINKDKTFKDVGENDQVAVRPSKREIMIDGEVRTFDSKQFLIVLDRKENRVTGDYLTRARRTTDESGGLAVAFNFNSAGAFKFQNLTSRNKPLQTLNRRLAILLDDQVHSAPAIQETISSSGRITGDFDAQEIDELVSVLNAGALDVPLKKEPISEFTVSPLIGDDVIRKGVRAFIIAGIAVLVFMLGYYMLAGAIADLCLVLNLILVMGTMSLIQATFTLPGLAGIVLTIGMAVDANVLIFERIREEQSRGSSLRMSIQNGFGKAFTTIVDANVTTLITAVILFYIGTDQVRGFAVTLFIGIVMSMFAALYFGRLLFDICERSRMSRRMMIRRVIGDTSIRFTAKRQVAAVLSLVLIIAGMATLMSRGQENLDIDFTGGTMITFQLTEPATTDDVRSIVEQESGLGTVTIERLQLSDEEDMQADEGRYFRLRTTRRDSEMQASTSESGDDSAGVSVQLLLAKAFDQANSDGKKLQLRRIKLSASDLREIDGSTEEEANSDPFDGGHEVELTFSGEGDSELTETTVLDYLVNAMTRLFGDEYSDVENLFEVEGTSGSGTNAVEGQVAKFSAVTVRASSFLDREKVASVIDDMGVQMQESPVFDEVNSFDSSVASEMKVSAVLAILASLAAIVAYIWFRFQAVTFGLAAVVALVHDVLVVLGVVAIASKVSGTPIGGILDLYDFKINLAMIAAFLTIVGYSLNDTIVVFDRIREVRGKNPSVTEDMVNTSLNQTLSRTLLTSLTTFLVVLILYFLGGEGIHGFAFCLVVGVIVGTYSSIFVATPVLLWLMNRNSTGGRSTATA